MRRIGLADLDASPIDWDAFDSAKPEDPGLDREEGPACPPVRAVADVIAGFEPSDRGKLVMACGTGKTFTSLRRRAARPGATGRQRAVPRPVHLLLSQTLREWTPRRL